MNLSEILALIIGVILGSGICLLINSSHIEILRELLKKEKEQNVKLTEKIITELSGFANAYSDLSTGYANALVERGQQVPTDFKTALVNSINEEEDKSSDPELQGGVL